MSSVIRVMLADDSSIVRRLVSQVVQSHPECDVVHQAKNGLEALDQIQVDRPDILLLDVDMPVLDGIQTVTQLREFAPQLPVVMCSSETVRGRRRTVQALCHGATDYVTKPVGAGHVQEALGKLQNELLPKVLYWGTRQLQRTQEAEEPAETTVLARREAVTRRGVRSSRSRNHVELLTVTVPTGGLRALTSLIQSLPADLELPVIVTQPLPELYTEALAGQLAEQSQLSIAAMSDGEPIKPGTVWIAPCNQFTTVSSHDTHLIAHLRDECPDHPDASSVEVLLRSVAQTFGKHTLTVLLEGADNVPFIGCQELHDVGGRVLTQDESLRSCSAASPSHHDAKSVDAILPLCELQTEILQELQLASPTAKCR